MEINYRNPKIILIAGKARSGKNTIGDILKKLYETDQKRVVISPYTKYLKRYIEEITGKEIDENDKPRELLQQLGVEIIREKLSKRDMFITRQMDDIDIYSYFFDVIIIPDVRFPEEIDRIREKYSNVTVIKVMTSLTNSMSLEEKNHITETALDNYSDDEFDYVLENDDLSILEKNVKKIYYDIR